MNLSRKVRRKLIWIAFGLLTLLLKWMIGPYPALIESYYSRGIFLGVRWFFDNFLTWIPIPLIYFFVTLVLLVAIKRGRKYFVAGLSWRQKLLHSTLSLAAILFGGIGLFFWVWGFNYSRVAIEQHLGLNPRPLVLKDLKKELELETSKIIEWRQKIPGIGDEAFSVENLPPRYEEEVHRQVERWLRENEYPTIGKVRGRELLPQGVFLSFSSSGLYFPFTGEGHVDAGVHPLQKPYIIAHEMSHGYGFGDEGTCNFTGYLACIHSEDPAIVYSGHLNYWRTLAVNYLRYEPDQYREFRSKLPIGIQRDLDAINDRLQAFPDLMPKLRYYAYDSYLKAQGIKEGMKNYNRVIMLVHAWRDQRKM